MASTPESQPTNWLVRIGTGENFRQCVNRSKFVWSVNTTRTDGKGFFKNWKAGDLLWFVENGSESKIVAVATAKQLVERVNGPIIDLTETNEELGWEGDKGGESTHLVRFDNLYNLTSFAHFSKIRGQSTYRRYKKETCAVDLPVLYNQLESLRKPF